jgi:hypothetical protein
MTDVATRKPLHVEMDRDVRPYLSVSVPQLVSIQQLLDRHRIGYRVDEHAISIDGGPETTLIYFDRGADPHPIQALLDSVS